MPNLACFLRAVNVGARKCKMADLKALLEDELGFSDVKTLLNSGNVVFTAREKPPAALKLLEPAISKMCGFHVDCVVKTGAELRAALEMNPFPDSDQKHVVIILTQKAPSAAAVKALAEKNKGPEILRLVGKDLFIAYPEGIGESKLSATIIDKATGMPGTGRNMNTIAKIVDLLETTS